MLDQLLTAMVQSSVASFRQKMAANNPYSKQNQTSLYNTFRAGWYKGYLVGFLMKAALGAGAAKLAKGTKVYTRVSKLVKSTKAGRLAAAVGGKVDAAQLHVAGLALDRTEKIGISIVRGAKNIGSSIQLARLSRTLDFDTSRLPQTQQKNVRIILRRNGEDGARELNEMSAQERKLLLSEEPLCGSRVSKGAVVSKSGSSLCSLGDSRSDFYKLFINGDLDLDDIQKIRNSDFDYEGRRVTTQHYIELAERGVDIENVYGAVTTKRGKIVYLARGSGGEDRTGMKKIAGKHVMGEYNVNGRTSFFRLGQEVTIDGVLNRCHR